MFFARSARLLKYSCAKKPLSGFAILFIGIGVAVATRFTGINTIMFYGTQILTEAGFGRQIAIIANVANGLTSVLATFFGIWMLGKIGRVTMFKTGIVGTMLSLLTIALAA